MSKEVTQPVTNPITVKASDTDSNLITVKASDTASNYSYYCQRK